MRALFAVGIAFTLGACAAQLDIPKTIALLPRWSVCHHRKLNSLPIAILEMSRRLRNIRERTAVTDSSS